MNSTPLPDTRQLGRSLRMWRSLRRLKQSALADQIGVSQASISRWESGRAALTLPEQQIVRSLMAARLDSAADFALGRMVRGSSAPMHLVCDLSHRLLAMSPARERRCRLSEADLMGKALWTFATPQIVEHEGRLDEMGWYEPAPDAIEFDTEAAPNQAMPIDSSRMRWVRLQLSDGSYVRLTETVNMQAL